MLILFKVYGFSGIWRNLIVLLSDTKLFLYLMVLINNQASIVMKLSAMSSNWPLFAWYLSLHYLIHGVSIKYMSRMCLFIEILTKQCICTNLLDSMIQNILSMSVSSRGLYMVSNKHLLSGTKEYLIMLPHWVFLRESLVTICSFTIMALILLT